MNNKLKGAADESYIRPKTAWELMKAAQRIKRTVYIYGATGYGKTAFAAAFLARKKAEYYTVKAENLPEAMEKNPGQEQIVVVDDLHTLLSAQAREDCLRVLEALCDNPRVWLILISRASLPAWLKGLYVRRMFMIIGEQELSFSEKEEAAYLAQWGISLMPQSAVYLQTLTGGYPLALRIGAMRLRTLPKSGKRGEGRRREEFEAIEAARRDFWDYLQTEVFDAWDVELQKFLMDISVVDTFTLSMACQITKRSDAGKLLLLAQESGSYLSEKTVGGQTVYALRRPMRLAMEKRLKEHYTRDYIDKLYQGAGEGYELCNETLLALSMYEKCHNETGISRILIANAKKSAGSGHYWEMRRYYYALSEAVIKKSPELMAGMSLLASIAMNDEESERWYAALAAYTAEQTGSAKKTARARLLCLDIALPQRGTSNMTETLKSAITFISQKQAVLPELSLTNNQPSLMNGGKDFCAWSRRDKALATSIGKPVERLLGAYGRGVVSLGLAESFFEKGEEAHEVQVLAQKGWMQASAGGRPEMLFVAVGLLAWQSVFGNRIKDALESLESFRKNAVSEAVQLLAGIDTLNTWFLLYTGKSGEAADWMKSAPDEDKEFCTLERYRYIIKARVYLATGRNQKAAALLQKLLFYAEKRQRTYISIEARLLLSVTEYRLGEKEWKVSLQEAVAEAEAYGFVRVLTREGAAVFPLLKAGHLTWKDAHFQKQVLKEAERMARFYPAYLSARQEGGGIMLSDKALTVLRMQAEGKTVDQIAGELYLSRSGVKYYIQDTYKKLGVSSKAAAITEAANRKIL